MDESSASSSHVELGEELLLPSSSQEEVTSPQVRTITVNDNKLFKDPWIGSMLVVPVCTCTSYVTTCMYVHVVFSPSMGETLKLNPFF